MKRVSLHKTGVEWPDLLGQLMPVFDMLPDVSFFVKNREGRFRALNRLACEFCGVRSARDAVGRTDRDFFSGERAETYTADDRVVLRTGRPILNRIEPAPGAEGLPQMVVTTKLPLRDGSGRVTGVVGFSRRIDQMRFAPAALKRLSAALAHLVRHHAEPMSTPALARMAGLSMRQFERTFRRTFRTTPRQYLIRVRVEAACRLLQETEDNIAAIALRCGFFDQAHFTRAFTARMGISPSRYRREMLG
ncbi:MAG: AraC family transcriptional regulator [Kiritimatiellia bacterium]